MNILIVDPNEIFATMLSEELKREGYDVELLTSSESALEKAREQNPDLVMLDMALQNPGTFDLMQQLRELDDNMRLVLTPFMGEQVIWDVMPVPIQGVLPKPFFIPELPGKIQAVLQAPLDGSVIVGLEPEPEPAPKSAPVSSSLPETFAEIEPKPSQLPDPPPVSEPVQIPRRPSLSSEAEDGLSYEAFENNREKVERLMGNLAQEVGADAVLLTYGGGLLTWVGGLGRGEAESISRAVVHGWRTSAEVARILGREQVRFEQSIAGSDYMLYALSVDVNAILAVAIRGSAALGLLRHRARSTSEQIARMCS